MGFNPRTHVGCDRIYLDEKYGVTGFNPRTHVGCDGAVAKPTTKPFGFNPRTHVGCDVAGTALQARNSLFQSTHPRRVRQDNATQAHGQDSFNPRTHVGCDSQGLNSLAF